MKTNWDLSVFYGGFDDPAFAADLASLPERTQAILDAIAAPAEHPAKKLCGLIAHRSALAGGIPMDVPDFRDPAQRDAYRGDHACTTPSVAGDQLLFGHGRFNPFLSASCSYSSGSFRSRLIPFVIRSRSSKVLTWLICSL